MASQDHGTLPQRSYRMACVGRTTAPTRRVYLPTCGCPRSMTMSEQLRVRSGGTLQRQPGRTVFSAGNPRRPAEWDAGVYPSLAALLHELNSPGFVTNDLPALIVQGTEDATIPLPVHEAFVSATAKPATTSIR